MFAVSFAILSLLVTAHAVPTKHVKRGSGKAGVPWPVQEGTAAPVEAFFQSGSDLTWWYDYNKNYNPDLFPDESSTPYIGGEFIPMLFSTTFLNNGDELQPGFTELFGYNEPDNTDPTTGSDTSPASAASNWRQAVDSIRSSNPGTTFISPAVAGSIQWLKDFFNDICPSGLSGCTYAPSYVAVHAYQTDFTAFQNQVTEFYTTFGLPIIVSEFAWADFSTNAQPSQQEVYDYMGQTTLWLDETSWIYKYSWFGACRNAAYLYGVPVENRLMNDDGSLTGLGQQYVSGGHR